MAKVLCVTMLTIVAQKDATLEIQFFDRLTSQIQTEQVYGEFFLRFLYQKPMGKLILPLVSKNHFCSRFYGFLQKLSLSRSKIQDFVEKFNVDSSEFADQIESFSSFNDFFIRRLKPEARPLSDGAVMPADGRYLAIPDLSSTDGIWVKGKYLNLAEMLQSEELASRYRSGSMLIARLCPVDYHRFHFPFDCVPGEAQCVNGPLYSVSPIALKRNLSILSENKRVITPLQSDIYGLVQCIEVGATNVGSIRQTYQPNAPVQKGDEKGYFEFGGSCLILLFEPNRITFADDLLEYSPKNIEVRALMGQRLGVPCK